MTADWMTAGLCQLRAYRPLFADQPPQGMGRDRRTAAAKAVCTRCPVKETCLAFALATEGQVKASARSGVLGGCSPAERARLAGVRP